MREPIFIERGKCGCLRKAWRMAPDWVVRMLKVPNGYLGFESQEECNRRILIDDEIFKSVENEFRLWSFHLYYDMSFVTIPDLTVRFCKALLASAQPVSKQKIIQWKSTYDAKKESGEFRSEKYKYIKQKEEESEGDE